MEIKILQVFLGADGLPYKDQERTVHFPIVGSGFQGASNTTKIRFYYDELVEQDDSETSWVACAKLPNGKIGSKVLETDYDSTLGEHYALLELDSFYFQYKGDVYISLQGYQGGVQVDYDEETELYTIYGTPTIAATGSIKLSINYATQFVGSGETSNVNFQRILADLGTKLGIRATSIYVEELPTVGNPDTFYVIHNDLSDPNKTNIYIWNSVTEHYIWVGDNTLDLGNYYTQEQGDNFEQEIENRVTSVENELESVASGSPKGVYATVSALQAAYPTGTSGIFVVTETGNWYYWDGTQWTSGGTYLSSSDYSLLDEKINAIEPINLDIGTVSAGKYVAGDGTLGNSTGSNATDYIEVKPLSTIVIKNATCQGGRAICFYDKNKTWIKYYFTGTGAQTNFVLKTDDITKYIRFTFFDAQVPEVFYANVIDKLSDYFENEIGTLEDTLYTENDYHLQKPSSIYLFREPSDTRAVIAFNKEDFKNFNGKFKMTSSSSTFLYQLVGRNDVTGDYVNLGMTWTNSAEYELVPTQEFDHYILYLKKDNDALITDSDLIGVENEIKLYTGIENIGSIINYATLEDKFKMNTSISPVDIQKSNCTDNPDGSITVASGGYYFAYYYLKDVLIGDVAVRFYDNSPNVVMQVAKSSQIGQSATPYITMNNRDGYKVIVLGKDNFNSSYPYLCVRIDNRYNESSYTFSNLIAIDTQSISQNVDQALYVSPNGSDSNDGKSTTSPLATVNKALSLGASNILLLGGKYNQQIDLANAKASNIEIKSFTYNDIPLFQLDESTIATSETKTNGYTKVYQFTTDVTFEDGYKWLFQDGIADVSTLISDEERNALQRGYEYRCSDTKIEKCSSTVLADALNEIDNYDGYKWFKDGTTVYFSRPSAVNSTNPICKSPYKSLILNGKRSISLTLAGISVKYMCVNLAYLSTTKVYDCKCGNTYYGGAFVYDRCLSVEFVRCEAYRTFINTNGDGFNGHSALSGEVFSKQTTCTLIDCWSHDNQDDGYSDHERSEITIIGGLYEYNGKAGITPSYGSHCTCYNVYSRKNINGFYYTGSIDPLEGGKYGQMTCFYCVAENNKTYSGSSGFIVDGTGNSVTLIGCKSIGNNYAYNSQLGTITTMIDCSALNNTYLKGGSGTYTIKNTTLVE